MINHIWGNIYIGDDRDANSLRLIKKKEITAFLDLTKLHINEKLDEEAILQVEEAIIKLGDLLSRGNKVLVYCHAGIDRAPFVVAYYLHTEQEYPFSDAYDFVKHRRPQTIQHYEWYQEGR